jgi:peptide chain release factor 2
MHKKEIAQLVDTANEIINNSELDNLEMQWEDVKTKMQDPDVWVAGGQGNSLSKMNKSLESKILLLKKLISGIEDIKAAEELDDQELLNNAITNIQSNLTNYQQINYLSGEHDFNNCLLTIHAGTGGIDAEDFAAMLCSMYQSFCKNQGWYTQTIAISVGQEGGLKTVTLDIQGEYAYGLLKEEVGVHRLVRISPFNSGKTRETSFALVEVLPQGLEQASKIEIKEEDLKWEYSTASGNGGQSVNTTYSAVKLTHTPTGLTVSCQNERSQVQNKQQALKYLKDKIAILEWEREQKLKQEMRGEYHSVEWGSQVRNYVLHPYKLVKDVRSGWETSDVLKVLEQGEILDIIWSVKASKKV